MNGTRRVLVASALALVPPLSLALALSPVASSRRPTAFPNSVPIQRDDLNVIVRQTGQTAPAAAAIGVPAHCACRHDFAQAFAMDPLPLGTSRANSGLLKLTCPHLVRAVDVLEDEGVMSRLNAALKASAELRDAAMGAHAVHADARRDILRDPRDLIAVRSKLGERGAEAFLSAGVAGSSEKTAAIDVKCLHAWLADRLFRGQGESPLGDSVERELRNRGVKIGGTEACRLLCDPGSDMMPLPPKPRNRQRLRTGKETARRKRRKYREKSDVGSGPELC